MTGAFCMCAITMWINGKNFSVAAAARACIADKFAGAHGFGCSRRAAEMIRLCAMKIKGNADIVARLRIGTENAAADFESQDTHWKCSRSRFSHLRAVPARR